MINKRGCIVLCSIILLQLCYTRTKTQHYNAREIEQHNIRVIIFDLDGVLLHSSLWRGFQNLLSALSYWELPSAFAYFAYENPKDALFTLMKSLPHEHDDSYTQCVTYDPNGNTLPRIMADWMAGRPGFSSNDIIPYLHTTIDHAATYTHLKKKILKQTVNIVFDAQTRYDITTILPAGKNLFDTLSQQHPDCTIGILSNYDHACFAHIMHKPEIQEIFKRIPQERIFISADMHHIKPDPHIYLQACNACDVNPWECLFIDDQETNVVAAREAGMHAVLFDLNHLTTTYDEIYTHLNM